MKCLNVFCLGLGVMEWLKAGFASREGPTVGRAKDFMCSSPIKRRSWRTTSILLPKGVCHQEEGQ